MKKIDQAKRLEIMTRIANGERSAASELADLYEQSGHKTLADANRLALGNDRTWDAVQAQAKFFVQEVGK